MLIKDEHREMKERKLGNVRRTKLTKYNDTTKIGNSCTVQIYLCWQKANFLI